jgi:glycosyltransferase involved in cell wall biosynthesis
MTGTAIVAEASRQAPVGVDGVSVVVPAHNEEQSVGAVIVDLIEGLRGGHWPYEIVVVDDGSTDHTARRAADAGARVVRHGGKRGYGSALKTGIGRSQYGLVGIIDADGTYPPVRLIDLVTRIEHTRGDMVVGARTGAVVAIPLLRRPAKWLLGRLAQAVCGQRIPDLNSGLRVFRRDVAMRFFGLLPDGFSLTTTLTLAMLSSGHMVEYMPVDYHPRRGRSKIRPVQDMVGFAGLILRIALYFAPLKIFLPLSGGLFVLATMWGVVSKFVLGELADVSTLVMVMTAVQVGVVGLLAELINHRLQSPYQSRER